MKKTIYVKQTVHTCYISTIKKLSKNEAIVKNRKTEQEYSVSLYLFDWDKACTERGELVDLIWECSSMIWDLEQNKYYKHSA